MNESMPTPGVTIAITRYAEPDTVISQSIRHALAQRQVEGEVLFIEQQHDPGISERDFPPSALALRTIRRRLGGLSEARNLALDEARFPLVLFLDADALADPDWASELATALSTDRCAVAGSRIIPRWPGKPPGFTRATVLRDQYSLLDLGPDTRPFHRVVGAGFGVDMTKLGNLRFDTGLGRRQGLLFGGEESDFCKRSLERGFQVIYVGKALVTHMIEAERCSWRWILKRMVFAGHGRASLGGVPSSSSSAGIFDWILMPAYLPFYATGWLWGKLATHATHHRRSGSGR